MATQARRDPQRRMQNVTQQHSCAVWLTPWLGLLTVSRRRFPRSAQFLSSAVTHHTAPHRTAPHRTAPHRTPHPTPHAHAARYHACGATRHTPRGLTTAQRQQRRQWRQRRQRRSKPRHLTIDCVRQKHRRCC
jgi:hypothetical protein